MTAAWDYVTLACDLACRIRDEDPAEVHRELYRKTQNELVALATVMAAMIPVEDRSPQELLAWTEQPLKQRHFRPVPLGGAA
jgi:hypothetical protein